MQSLLVVINHNSLFLLIKMPLKSGIFYLIQNKSKIILLLPWLATAAAFAAISSALPK